MTKEDPQAKLLWLENAASFNSVKETEASDELLAKFSAPN
jgi:hypothetical protein